MRYLIIEIIEICWSD